MTNSNLVDCKHREIGRLSAFKDTAGVHADLTTHLELIGSVAHQPAGGDIAPLRITGCILSRAAKIASCTRRLLKNPSGPTKRASGRSRASAAKAASISPIVVALSTRS